MVNFQYLETYQPSYFPSQVVVLRAPKVHRMRALVAYHRLIPVPQGFSNPCRDADPSAPNRAGNGA